MDDLVRRIENEGFAVVAGPIAASDLPALDQAYDRHFATSEVREGSTSLRSDCLLNASPVFDDIFMHAPLLAAARAVIGASFKLSAYHGRTLKPNAGAQGLHRDFRPLTDGWPMVGFILMVDAFTEENGATRFVAGSQSWDEVDPDAAQAPACGPAGAMVLYNGSVWHGHGRNFTASPRRSIQGALIRSDQPSMVDHAGRTHPQTAARLSPAARSLLGMT